MSRPLLHDTCLHVASLWLLVLRFPTSPRSHLSYTMTFKQFLLNSKPSLCHPIAHMIVPSTCCPAHLFPAASSPTSPSLSGRLYRETHQGLLGGRNHRFVLCQILSLTPVNFASSHYQFVSLLPARQFALYPFFLSSGLPACQITSPIHQAASQPSHLGFPLPSCPLDYAPFLSPNTSLPPSHNPAWLQ